MQMFHAVMYMLLQATHLSFRLDTAASRDPTRCRPPRSVRPMQAPLIMPCHTLSKARCSSADDSEELVHVGVLLETSPAAGLVCCTTVSCTWVLLLVLLTVLLLLAFSAMLLTQLQRCFKTELISLDYQPSDSTV